MKRTRPTSPPVETIDQILPYDVWVIILGFCRQAPYDTTIDVDSFTYGDALFSLACVNKACYRITNNVIPVLYEKESNHETIRILKRFPVRAYHVITRKYSAKSASTKGPIASILHTAVLYRVHLINIGENMIDNMINRLIDIPERETRKVLFSVSIHMDERHKRSFVEYCIKRFKEVDPCGTIMYIKKTIDMAVTVPLPKYMTINDVLPGDMSAAFMTYSEINNIEDDTTTHQLKIAHPLFPSYFYIFNL